MSDQVRQAKDRGSVLLQAGKLAGALEQFQRVIAAAPTDVGARQKVAEILVRLGRRPEAIAQYLDIVRRYAEAGHLFKAIALCKVILSHDAEHQSALQLLAELYSATRPAQALARGAPIAGELDARTVAAAAAPVPSAVGADDEYELLLEVEADAPAPSLMGGTLPVIPLFSQLSRDEFVGLLSSALELRTWHPGDAIVREGDEGHGMFAVVQGTVGVHRVLEGVDRKVATMGEGDFFGEMALMSHSRRLATVVAETEVVLLEFPREAMQRLIASHQGVAVALDAFYRERLLANLLRCNPLLAPLSDEQKVELGGKFEVKSYQPGEVILVQGQPGDGLYLVLRGTCGVIDRSGERYPTLGEGDAFGEISLALEQAVTANVRAQTRVVALKLEASVVKAMVLTNPQARATVASWVTQRLARTAELVSRRSALDQRV